jgi:hypothetical protein
MKNAESRRGRKMTLRSFFISLFMQKRNIEAQWGIVLLFSDASFILIFIGLH